ncbi:Ribonuclease [compost metagenome]
MSKRNFYVDILPIHPEVTGSCFYCSIRYPDFSTQQFIVDCGLFQEKKYQKLNETLPFKCNELDFVLVTHNHADHTGRLPMVVSNGYTGDIHCTNLTKELSNKGLINSCEIMYNDAGKGKGPILYTSSDLPVTFSLMKGHDYEKTFSINENVKVTFLQNGHLFGAASILLQVFYENEEPINILFAGDYNDKNVFFEVKKLPEWVKRLPLTIVQEATYGDTKSEDINNVFETNLIQAMENKNCTCVIPVFALGRSQEILLKLKNMQDEKILDKDIPIYLDGTLAIQYTNILLKHSDTFFESSKDFLPNNFRFVHKTSRDSIIKSTTRKIILTTSGMGSFGPAPLYFSKYFSNPNALIHFVGYATEGTLARKLSDAAEGESVKIQGMNQEKKAKVFHTNEFSAHAKADTMLNFLKEFSNIKLVLINHGQTETKKNFAKAVEKEIPCKEISIQDVSQLHRIGSYGLIKSFDSIQKSS